MNSREKFIWWKHGIIYHIYPRSFCDSNGDGIGDIPGIISKLDYLNHLGIDAIWLSPVFASPMKDMGYDVSSYREINPEYGTMADFQKLLKTAHLKKIKIILDIPVNHTSDQHPWFIESASSKDSPKRDWYIWHKGTGEKNRSGQRNYPNNWRAAFGGRAWTWDPSTEEFWLHSFLKEQPDLNWRNPEVKKAMFRELEFWMDMGVDGFRLDVANCISKHPDLPDNPYINLSGYPRMYDFQIHNNDRNQPESHEIYRDLRRLLDRHGAAAVGEILANEGRNEHFIAASYLGEEGDDELNLAFDFSIMHAKFNAEKILEILINWYRSIPKYGWPCHVLSCHDKSRAFTRLAGNSIQKAKILAALQLTQKGTPFIYYGDELGMKDGSPSKNQLSDPVGKRYWPFNKGRDPFRTPMQWDSSKNSGFTEGIPWLPVNDDYRTVNAAREEEKQNSMLSFYKRLISLRKSEEALYAGEWIPVDGGQDIISYYRKSGNTVFLIALNFSDKGLICRLSDSFRYETEISTQRQKYDRLSAKNFLLAPYEVLIARRTGE